MKKYFFFITLFVLCDLAEAVALASQNDAGWKPSGLDFVIISSSGEPNHPNLQDFVRRARNPSLFAFQPENARLISDEAEMEAGGLMVRIRFSNPDHPNYDYWAGIGNIFSQISLFSFYPTEEDTLKMRLISQTRYFTLAG